MNWAIWLNQKKYSLWLSMIYRFTRTRLKLQNCWMNPTTPRSSLLIPQLYGVFQDKSPFEYIKGFWLLSLSKSPIFNLPTCSSLKMFLMPLNVAPSGI